MKAVFAIHFLVAATVLARPATPPYELNLSFEALGKTYELTASEQALKNSNWNTEAEENPPVSAQKAMKLADKVRKSVAADSNELKWRITNVGLLPFGEKWVWLVHYQPFAGQYPQGNDTILVAVLMDGTSVKPKLVVSSE